MNTAVVQEPHHVHRRRQGHPQLPRLSRSSSSRRRARYLETAYLLLQRRAADASAQHEAWVHDVTHHTMVHENIKELHRRLPLRRAPHGHARCRRWPRSRPSIPRPRTSTTREVRQQQIFRLIAKMPTLAAFAYRHSHGPALRLPGQRPQLRRQLPPDDVPDDRAAATRCNPVLEQALEVLFILHADHEQNCSTNAMRVGRLVATSIPTRRRAAAIAALYGPLHGGANEAGPAHARGDRRPRTRSPSSSRK